MKKLLFALVSLFVICANALAADYELASPDGKLKAGISVSENITFSLSYDGQPLLSPSRIAVDVRDASARKGKKKGVETWGCGSKLKGRHAYSHNGVISALNYKKTVVDDTYNALTLRFADFTLLFRAYDEGLAYRFVYGGKNPKEVTNEVADFNFAKDFDALVPYVKSGTDSNFDSQLASSFENTYTPTKLSSLKPTRLAFMPMIVKAERGVKVVLAEADVENYPCMFLAKGGNANATKAFFAAYPKDVEQGGHNNLQQLVKSRHDYVALLNAGQKLPWRIVNVSGSDERLLGNDMVYRLAAPSRVGDTSWIRPGKVAWEWWNNWGLYKVPFKAGINTETYKCYMDFAARHGVEYVILDEGWAVNLQADLFKVVPEIDLEELVGYGKLKNVGIILWAGYKAFDRDMERVCSHYAAMGIKGFKIDFMDRNDADCVNFHYRAAAMAAKYRLLCDFHGTYAPTGLHRTYPNVVNFEGVAGLEQNKWSAISDYDQVQYDVIVPFARNLAGPMDYTQGAMLNGTRANYHVSYSCPMSQGTRCHQLAQYVVFVSPLNMLCDSPTHYDMESECTGFIASIPTVWDETVPLRSEVGEYVAVARRNGDKWYVGALTNWNARDLVLDLSPLGLAGKSGMMFSDGANADKFAEDYAKAPVTVPADGKLPVRLAPGGGVAIEF